MSQTIHPTAVIDPAAKLGRNVSVGPGVVIGAGVTIGDDVTIGAGAKIGAFTPPGEHTQITIGDHNVIHPDVHIMGIVAIGNDNVINATAMIGTPAQDKSYKGEPTGVRIGDGNFIGPAARIQRATMMSPEHTTVIGNKTYLMAGCGVGHDCVIDDKATMVDGAKLSGFVHVGEGATLSADVAVHQKVHIGKLAFVGPKALVANDILPFTIAVDSSSAEHHGAVHRAINKIGLERSGIDDASQHMIHKAYKAVFERGASFDGAPAKLREEPFAGNEYVAHMADFIERSQQDGRGLSISANTLRRRAAPDIAG